MAPNHSKIAAKDSNDKPKSKNIILPLVPTESSEDELTSENSIQFTLLSTPTDNDSAKYKVTARILKGGEDVRQALLWYTDTDRVLTGLNITDYSGARNILLTMLRGTPLTMFKSSLDQQAAHVRQTRAQADVANSAAIMASALTDPLNCNPAHITTARRVVLTNQLPYKVLAKAKRNLRRDSRKPADMKVRVYVQHLMRINNEEIPLLPPFQANQNLSTDELMDILLFGTPKSWQKEMDRQQFDPLDKPMNDVIDFMEAIESSEDFDGTKVETKKKTDSKKKASKDVAKTDNKDSNGSGKNRCMLHGWGHSTEDCKVLQAEAKRLKSNNDSDEKDNNSFSKSRNKTWSRKAQEAKKKTSSDLAAFIKKEVGKAMKTASKKRKSDDDDDSLNAFDLKDFNYEDMENLKIDDGLSEGEASC